MKKIVNFTQYYLDDSGICLMPIDFGAGGNKAKAASSGIAQQLSQFRNRHCR